MLERGRDFFRLVHEECQGGIGQDQGFLKEFGGLKGLLRREWVVAPTTVGEITHHSEEGGCRPVQ